MGRNNSKRRNFISKIIYSLIHTIGVQVISRDFQQNLAVIILSAIVLWKMSKSSKQKETQRKGSDD